MVKEKKTKVATVKGITVDTSTGRLTMQLTCSSQEQELISVQLPDREVSALIPRELFQENKNNPVILTKLTEISTKLLVGRQVRLYDYRGGTYAGFPRWKGLTFTEGVEAKEVKG